MAAQIRTDIADVLKDKSCRINNAFQQFQSKLKAEVLNLTQSHTDDERALYNEQINKLCYEYSWDINRIQTECTKQCQSLINSQSNVKLSHPTNQRQHSSIKHEANLRTDQSTHNTLQRPMESNQYSTDHQCNICFKSFSSGSALGGHMSVHSKHSQRNTIKTSSKSECNECGQSFDEWKRLAIHIRDIHGGYPYPCPDDECAEKFKFQSELMEHRKSAHVVLRCKFCGKCGFTRPLNLRNHELLHQKERPFPCHLCDKAFILVERLNAHLVSCHGEKPFQCTRCQATFAKKNELNIHEMQCNDRGKYNPMTDSIHSKPNEQDTVKSVQESPGTFSYFQCDWIGCDKQYKQRVLLHRHIREDHGGKPLQCSSCDESFTYKHELTMHWRSVHLLDGQSMESMEISVKRRRVSSSGNGGNFECGDCGKRLKSEDGLAKHKLLHQGHRSFACHLCETAFVLEERLRQHLINVHDTGPYKCGQCQKRFKKKMELKAHQIDECLSGSGLGQDEVEKVNDSNALQSTHSLQPLHGRTVFNHRL